MCAAALVPSGMAAQLKQTRPQPLPEEPKGIGTGSAVVLFGGLALVTWVGFKGVKALFKK